ncbi:hypothetical protein [Streptomyces sp. MAI_2237]
MTSATQHQPSRHRTRPRFCEDFDATLPGACTANVPQEEAAAALIPRPSTSPAAKLN